MTVTIRFARPDDVPTILGFVRELAAFEKEPEAVVATEALMHEALFGARPAAEALIAEIDGARVGMAVFYHNFSTWTGVRGIWLDDLYVTPGARGAGAGSALLRELARVAVDRGCARFEWWVLDWNTPAVELYRRIGAEAMDAWTVQRVSGEALTKLAGR
ncbi:GNAT family N-acetyltransferase [Sphingomonas sp. H39-1-10]|uniref:GNAT family N-acetyltransferase n=1 Tax=Sphingomonas pollutisoli TaxID=3030829 RepID=UPI0023B8C7C6|nr:GNAT family N-acetyltransferase [Sphingomonas pollutisoli]MDF0490627.1 GNAT family N-acetyltransferase [Sphingomonas pollutisoli]